MRCPHCGADSPDGMKFCGHCGAALGLICASCGTDNPAEFKFCGRCGAPLDGSGLRERAAPEPYLPRPQTSLATGTLPGEMKQVTVLFCDIVNSTGLAERLGAEGMRDLVNRFLELSIAEVRRFDGTVPEFTGDGFMAVFGAPRAYEDHVRRALLAALGIRLALGGERGTPPGANLALPVRMGIHSGPVVFGPVGGDFGTETVIGDTANIAARLQQAAEPGVILFSDAIWLSAQGYARGEPAGPLAVKGKAELIPAYRLLGVSRSRVARDGRAPSRTTDFVDRTDEMAALLRLFEEVESGRGRVVGVVGEPGIGKSRIVDELRRRVAPGRITWVEGRCDSYGTMIPYRLVLDLLRNNCGIVDADTPEEIADKVSAGLRHAGMDPDQDAPLLLHLLGIKALEDPALESRPEAIKGRMFDVCRQMAINGSVRRPLALVVEDLHWVDKLSEEFLQFAAQALAGARVLLIATYRPSFTPSWSGLPFASRVALEPLSLEDSRHVVRAVLLAELFSSPVTEEIVARADGNPLFLEQLVLHAGKATGGQAELMVPPTIHDVIMARIDRLPNEAKQLLQTAAVIGREFSQRLITAVWPGAGPIDHHLRELCGLEFLDEWPDDDGSTYVFRHALTQEAAYGSLLERHRRACHARIGHALETLYEDRTDEVAELLALHFGRSDEAEKAVDYAIAAAAKAGRVWANTEALKYFEAALRRLDGMPDTADNRLRRIDAVLKQAEIKYSLGKYVEQIKDLTNIQDLVAGAEDPYRRSTWNYWLGFLHGVSGGRPEAAIDHCREAAKIASTAGMHELNAFAESCLAQVYMVAGMLDDGMQVGERALASFELMGNRWWAGRTLWHLTAIANFIGDWERSLGYCRRGLEHGVALQDLRLKVVGWTRMGLAYIQQGNPERGIECCDAALALTPIPRDAAWARVVRGYGKIKSRDIDSGVAEMAEALAWFEGVHMRWTHIIGTVWLAEGHLRRGNRASARPLIDHVLQTSRATGYLQYEGRGCWLLGEYLSQEAPSSAEEYIRNAILIFERIGARNDLARAIFTHGMIRYGLGEVENAKIILGEARAIFQELGTLDEIARVEGALAELHQTV